MQKNKNAAYLVIIAKSPAELKAEGKALHHCVGSMGYEQKFAREETLIFFIRSADAPDVPLVTMEYSLKSKKILQCVLGKHYLSSELNDIYDLWYSNKLKSVIFPQYKGIESVKNKIIKDEPTGSAYDELMEMIHETPSP